MEGIKRKSERQKEADIGRGKSRYVAEDFTKPLVNRNFGRFNSRWTYICRAADMDMRSISSFKGQRTIMYLSKLSKLSDRTNSCVSDICIK